MPDAAHVASGKVREIYALDDERLLLVASDRISTFDVVLPTEIPDKGRVLTGLSGFWFARTRAHRPEPPARDPRRRPLDGVPAARDAADRVRRPRLPRPARAGRTTCATARSAGHALPEGLRESERAAGSRSSRRRRRRVEGHDENIDAREAAELVGEERFREVERVSHRALRVRRGACRRARDHHRRHEVRARPRRRRQLVLADEALTPDSSRFWPADAYEPGGAQPSFDKQFVRDYCETLGWDKTAPGPELPDDVVAGTRAKYVEAFERLTGIAFDDYLADPERRAAVRATVLVRPKAGILDPQGAGGRDALRHLGFDVDGRARRPGRRPRGRGDRRRRGPAQVERMCEQLLANPLIEIVRGRGRTAEPRSPRRRRSSSPARTTTATRSGRSSARRRRRCSSGTRSESCRDARRGRAARRLLVRRLPALRRDRPLRARHAARSRSSRPTAGSCSGSATASRSSARRGCCPACSGRTRRSRFVCRDVAAPRRARRTRRSRRAASGPAARDPGEARRGLLVPAARALRARGEGRSCCATSDEPERLGRTTSPASSTRRATSWA